MWPIVGKILFGVLGRAVELIHSWVTAQQARAMDARVAALEARVKSMQEAQEAEERIAAAQAKVKREQAHRDTVKAKRAAMIDWAKRRLEVQAEELEEQKDA